MTETAWRVVAITQGDEGACAEVVGHAEYAAALAEARQVAPWYSRVQLVDEAGRIVWCDDVAAFNGYEDKAALGGAAEGFYEWDEAAGWSRWCLPPSGGLGAESPGEPGRRPAGASGV